MTSQLRYRPQARLDLKDIYRHIAEYHPPAAGALIRQLHAKAQMLAAVPQMGQGVPELSPGLRRFPFGSYVIFYYPIQGGVDIVRILHGARDRDSIFRDDPA